MPFIILIYTGDRYKGLNNIIHKIFNTDTVENAIDQLINSDEALLLEHLLEEVNFDRELYSLKTYDNIDDLHYKFRKIVGDKHEKMELMKKHKDVIVKILMELDGTDYVKILNI